MRRFALQFLAAAIVLMVSAAPGNAAARRNLPGFSTNVLPANDDDSTGQVNIGFTINLFGTPYSKLYVNNNGNVTFDDLLSTFTPFGLSGTQTKIIAAYFGDVDTRSAGSGKVTYGNATVDGHNAFGVEFPGVGYYAAHSDKLNTFELILIERADIGAGAFDIEFNYDSMQWETGDVSGGSGGLGGASARVGYSNGLPGSANVSFELPGSGVNGALLNGGSRALVSNSLNSNVPGRYIFSSRGGVIGGGGGPVATPATTTPVLVFSGLMLIGIVMYLKTRIA